MYIKAQKTFNAFCGSFHGFNNDLIRIFQDGATEAGGVNAVMPYFDKSSRQDMQAINHVFKTAP